MIKVLQSCKYRCALLMSLATDCLLKVEARSHWRSRRGPAPPKPCTWPPSCLTSTTGPRGRSPSTSSTPVQTSSSPSTTIRWRAWSTSRWTTFQCRAVRARGGWELSYFLSISYISVLYSAVQYSTESCNIYTEKLFINIDTEYQDLHN